MSNLLSNQHVRRRRAPEGRTSYFAPGSKLNRKEKFRGFAPRGPRRRSSAAGRNSGRKKTHLSLSAPFLPLAASFMLLVIAVLAIAGRNVMPEDWMSRDVISLSVPENGNADYNMAVYSGLNTETQPKSAETGQEINLAAAVVGTNTPAASASGTAGGTALASAARTNTVAAAVSSTGSSTLSPAMPSTGPVLETAASVITFEQPHENQNENIPLDLTGTLTWKDYKVKKGDSVSKIAAVHALSMDAIIAANNISNARLLREGETIRIPNMDGIPYLVKKGDSLSKISRSMGVPLEAILDANNIERDLISAGEMIFIPGARMKSEELKLAIGEFFAHPVKGARLTSAFGWRNDPISGVRRHHGALDLAASTGTTVNAASGGNVSAAGFNANYGKYVILNHGSGLQTLYAHLNTISVSKGDSVTQGQKIGEVGSTGYSTGPHLHFGVYKNDRAVNPLDFLQS